LPIVAVRISYQPRERGTTNMEKSMINCDSRDPYACSVVHGLAK
jgi:hypothetical protein